MRRRVPEDILKEVSLIQRESIFMVINEFPYIAKPVFLNPVKNILHRILVFRR
jgi:hypothetical protein